MERKKQKTAAELEKASLELAEAQKLEQTILKEKRFLRRTEERRLEAGKLAAEEEEKRQNKADAAVCGRLI